MKKPKINWEELEEHPYTYAEKLSAKKLENILRYAADLYYNSAETILTDEIYDALKDLLKKKDKKNKFLKEVGAPIKSDKKKVKLPFPMNSLDKIKHDTDEINKWKKKYKGPYVVSDKLDGGAALLHYKVLSKNSIELTSNSGKKGKFYFYSRGKNNVGQDITKLLELVVEKEILNKIKESDKELAIRGELIITEKNFKKIKDEYDYKNSRNAIAGVINAKDLDKRKNIIKKMEFIPHSILYPHLKSSDQFKKLKKLGFKLPYHKVFEEITNKRLSKLLIERKKESEYEMDGLVVTDNQLHHVAKDENPKHSFAFKSILTEKMVQSTVLEVLWKVSKDGYFKPKIQVEPFTIDGVEINYSTVHNAKFVYDNILGPGAVVLMTRSGGVIPKVHKVIKPASNGKPQMPKEKYKWNETGVDIITNDDTQNEEIEIKKMIFFFKKIEVKNLGEGIVRKLVLNGYDSILKILKLKPDTIAEIDGLGEKSGKKIFNNLHDQLSKISLEKFMNATQAFGRNFGEERFVMIFKEYPDILKLSIENEPSVKQEMSKKKEIAKTKKKILSVKGMAEKMASKFIKGIPKFLQFCEKVKKYINLDKMIKGVKKKQKIAKKGKLNGKSIVFTGFRDAALKKQVESSGGKVSSGISGKTDILVVAKKALMGSSKVLKAQEKNIEIVTLDEFLKEYLD